MTKEFEEAVDTLLCMREEGYPFMTNATSVDLPQKEVERILKEY